MYPPTDDKYPTQQHRIATLEADYKICKHSLENLKHDMIYKNAKNKELEAENAVGKADYLRLTTKVEALKAEVAALKDELASALEDLDREVRVGNDLMKENLELRKDAERHRYMRFADLDSMCEKYWPNGEVPTGDAYDAVVDQAMKEAQS